MSTQTAQSETEWARYLSQLMAIQQVKNSQLADAIGVSRSTAGNWINGKTQPDWQQVRAVAGFFNRPVTEALIRAGYLTEDELEVVAPPLISDDISNEQLLVMLKERLNELNTLREIMADNETQPEAEEDSKLPKKDRAPRAIRGRQGPTGRR